MPEVADPQINDAMADMLAVASPGDLNATVLDLAALATALCGALGEYSNVTGSEVLQQVLAG
jgi:hypothetical protein